MFNSSLRQSSQHHCTTQVHRREYFIVVFSYNILGSNYSYMGTITPHHLVDMMVPQGALMDACFIALDIKLPFQLRFAVTSGFSGLD
jgi:hypothetical protein